jgi:hypothetical protein
LPLRSVPSLALVTTLLVFASTVLAAGPKKSPPSGASRRRHSPATSQDRRTPITHAPLTEQVVLTPIPIWVESRDETVTRVILRYKAFGSQSWTAVDMTKVEGGWTGEVPCRDVGTVTGVLRYYVTAYDEEGKSLGGQGTMKKPTKVKIRRALKGEPPRLPGRQPPARCSDPTDCPPGFPGCTDRTSGDNSCMADDDCDEGMVCGSEQECQAPPEKQRKTWISFGATQDVVLFTNANVCAPENQDSGQFSCLRQSDGLPYFGTPLPESAALRYGAATTRIFLGFDQFLSAHFSFGLRLGYVVRGHAPELVNRKGSIPLLAEGRIAYWFTTGGSVRPMLYLAGGYAPSDFKFPTFVEEDRSVAATQQNPDTQTLDVWTTRGPWFGGAGIGVMFATSSATGFLLEVGGVGTFPAVSTVIRPALSFAVGF